MGRFGSEDLGPLERLSFAEGRALINHPNALRVTSPTFEWVARENESAPFPLEIAPGGGGGAILDGSLGPRSGFLLFRETSGSPPDVSNAASLFTRENVAGKVELVVQFPGGATAVLAIAP